MGAGIGLAAKGIGTAITIGGALSAGRAQRDAADYNASQQAHESRMRFLTANSQANIAKMQAKMNYKFAAAQKQLSDYNASLIESNGRVQMEIDRRNSRKVREQGRRLMGEQRANIAASGLVESSGTPLDILAETAASIQLEQEDHLYERNSRMHNVFQQAQAERLGGSLALKGAAMDRDSAIAGANMQRFGARIALNRGLQQADLTRAGGQQQMKAARIGAFGSAFSGAADMFGYQRKLSYYKSE